jgi:hypothetical protein
MPRNPHAHAHGPSRAASVDAYVAVSPLDGQMTSMILPSVEAKLMSLFLANTAAQFPDEHCVMFLDGAGWHKAHDLTAPSNMALPATPLLTVPT